MKLPGEIRYIDFHTHSQGGGSDAVAVRNLMAGDEVPADFAANTLFSAGIHPWQLTDGNLGQMQTELLLTAAHPHVVMIGRPWVIHGFRGSGSLAASLAEEGFWFSLGAEGLTAEVLESVYHEKLLLETDDSGRQIAEVYHLFESVTGYDEQRAERLVRNNFNSLLNFSL